MSKETIFRATDPTGKFHYRGSLRRTYTHGVLIASAEGIWRLKACCGSKELAEKELAARQRTFMRYEFYRGYQAVVSPLEIVPKKGG